MKTETETKELDRLLSEMRAAECAVADYVSELFPVGARCSWEAGNGSSHGMITCDPDPRWNPMEITVENERTGRMRRVHVTFNKVRLV